MDIILLFTSIKKSEKKRGVIVISGYESSNGISIIAKKAKRGIYGEEFDNGCAYLVGRTDSKWKTFSLGGKSWLVFGPFWTT